MATRKIKSTGKKSKAEPLDPNERLAAHIKEITAIHAHTDALALAIAEAGADTFTDGSLSAIVFDLEERLMHVRDGLESLPKFTSAGKEAHHA